MDMTGGLMMGSQAWWQPTLRPEDSSNFSFATVTFDAGTRNKFHKHSCDQLLVMAHITITVKGSQIEQTEA